MTDQTNDSAQGTENKNTAPAKTDGRDTVVSGATTPTPTKTTEIGTMKIETAPADKGATADDLAHLNTDNKDSKDTNKRPTVYKAIPVTATPGKDGTIMPTFVLKPVRGVIVPEVGDKVRFMFGNKQTNGTVVSISKQGVITLNTIK